MYSITQVLQLEGVHRDVKSYWMIQFNENLNNNFDIC